jgi:uncharacterized protein YoaH (UPF0181 family)
MLSLQQQKVVEINNITAKQIESGGYIFLIAGREVRQSPSLTSEGAVKKGIGYVMSRYRK